MTNFSPTTYFAISLIAKDAIGCVMYTTTARNNKRYTPEKRADVANYDLANGIINIALQVLAIKPIEAGFKKLANTKFMNHFIKDVDEKMASTDSKFLKKVMSRKSALIKGSTALSSVASLILHGNRNGWEYWYTEDGKQLGQVEGLKK